MSAPDGTKKRPIITLRFRLLVMLSSIVLLILLGQTLHQLSSEVTKLDHHIAADGVALAEHVASAATPIWFGPDHTRFDHLFEPVRDAVDLVSIAIVDTHRFTIAHSDPTLRDRPYVDESHHDSQDVGIHYSLPRLTSRHSEYDIWAPITRNGKVMGHVHIRFRSSQVADLTTRILRSAAAMGLLWLTVAALLGTIFVRRITRPLAALTEAASSLSEGDPDDVRFETFPTDKRPRDEVGVLHATFSRLVERLQAKHAENSTLVTRLERSNTHLQEHLDGVTADLRAATGYLELILRSMDEGVLTCDNAGRVVRSNPGAALQLQGFSEPAPGLPVAELIPDGAPLEDAVKRAIAEDTATQLELTRECGTRPVERHEDADHDTHHIDPSRPCTRTLVFHITPMRQGETIRGAVITVVDETVKRHADARLRRHDRLASLGTIAAGLAHELGNTMHAIHGFSILLMRDLPEDDDKHADALAIREENDRAIALLERFLLFARPARGGMEPISVDTLARDALHMCSYKVREASIEVRDELNTGDIEVRCDARLMTQAFVNLVLNAIDALSGREERVLTVSSKAARDERIQLTFTDTGCGFDPSLLERVFDPFFTTKGAHGTGLGLSIVHQIIENHEGSVSVHSIPERGTSFTIELPVQGPHSRKQGSPS